MQQGRFGTCMNYGRQRVSLKFWNWLFSPLLTFLWLFVNQNHNLIGLLRKELFLICYITLWWQKYFYKIILFNTYFLYICKPFYHQVFAMKGKVIPPFHAKFNVDFNDEVISQHLSKKLTRYLTICATRYIWDVYDLWSSKG